MYKENEILFEQNDIIEVREIRKALQVIKMEIAKTNELLKLLRELMNENSVIVLTMTAHDTGLENGRQGYVIAFKN